jgi:hypothetical protein
MTIEAFQIAKALSYVLMGCFFMSSILALWARSYKTLSSITLFFVWAFYSYTLHYDKMAHLSDVHMYEAIAWFDLITAVLLTMWLKGSVSSNFVRTLPKWLRYDTITWVYSIIILSAAICHFVMLRDVVLLLDESIVSYVPSIIYVWYDELIILTQVLQLMVATYGMVGMVRAIRKLRKDNRLCSVSAHNYNKSIPTYNESIPAYNKVLSTQKNSEDQT